MVGDGDQRAWKDAVGRDDVGAVDPDVSSFQARGAARRNLDGRERRSFRHAAILNASSAGAAGRVELRSRASDSTDGRASAAPRTFPYDFRSRKIICSALLSSGAFAKEPYSATGARPASRN